MVRRARQAGATDDQIGNALGGLTGTAINGRFGGRLKPRPPTIPRMDNEAKLVWHALRLAEHSPNRSGRQSSAEHQAWEQLAHTVASLLNDPDHSSLPDHQKTSIVLADALVSGLARAWGSAAAGWRSDYAEDQAEQVSRVLPRRLSRLDWNRPFLEILCFISWAQRSAILDGRRTAQRRFDHEGAGATIESLEDAVLITTAEGWLSTVD